MTDPPTAPSSAVTGLPARGCRRHRRLRFPWRTGTAYAWGGDSSSSTPGGRPSSPGSSSEKREAAVDRVADYVFLRELGRGEHSQVYLARTPRRLGTAPDTVVVKMLSLTGTDGFDALADELSLFAALGAPQLVPMYDVGMDGGPVFYAMRHEPSGALAAPARDLSRRERILAVGRAARGAHEMH